MVALCGIAKQILSFILLNELYQFLPIAFIFSLTVKVRLGLNGITLSLSLSLRTNTAILL